MKLKSLYLNNFRSYKDFRMDFDESLNVIIGKNDIGKSTILDALEIFFNSEKVNVEIDDYCVKAVSSSMTIGVIFEIEKEKKYTIDTIPTSLDDEFLLNEDGYLEIQKTWDCSKRKITASSLKQFIVAKYPKKFTEAPLICLKNPELKKVFKDYKDHEAINNINVRETTNSEMRQAIYQIESFSEFRKIKIPIDKIDGKDVWSSISYDLPLFFLFQSDRANKDTDKDVQDPLKAITKSAIDEVAEKLEDVKKQIEKSAKKIGEETLEKLAEMNPELAKVLKPDISNKAWDSLFSFSFLGDDDIPINKRGSGVRRLILLNYFRAEADRKNKTNKNVIFAIEEPETSQHPNHQQLLIDALIEIASKVKSQVIVTTHSPEIAKQSKNENLILIDKVDDENQLIEGDFKLKSIVETLGIVPYLGKLVICLEGENDRSFLLNLNQHVPEFKSLIDLKQEKISLIPMNGSTLINWIKRDYLEGSNVIEFHIYDKDSDEKYKSSIDLVKSRKNGSFGLLTLKSEMENYIAPELYEERFNVDCSDITDWDNEDIPQFVMNKTELFKEKNAEIEKIIKQIANGSLSKQMTKPLLEKIGAYDEVESWFRKLKEMHEN